jgi:hypothetical protein
MAYRRLGLSLFAAAALLASLSAMPASAGSNPVIDDSSMQALTATFGGASPQPSTATIAHWFGQTVDPHNGVTYGYNMVGADPALQTSTTIQVDITPVVVNVAGRTYNGNDVVAATLASPQFATNDYGATTAATAAGSFPNLPALVEGSGGALSQNDAGQALQLEDATMRAQFNHTGGSGYHVILHPNVLPAVTINVPSTKGTLILGARGLVWADIDLMWWATRIQQLNSTADPTHLPLYLTNDVYLHIGPNIFNCCVIGFHGASEVPGHGTGNTHGAGNQALQTYAWASYISPSRYARPNGGTDWAVQDIHAVSHEISEWADDPFINNTVEPWKTPTAPQYGCSGLLETGDPVVGIGFAMGANTFEQGPNPNGTQSADGFYHPEDETYLPWFMRTAPNTIAEATQSPSANVGRYTLMGDLNPFPGFRQPATGC